MRPKERSVLQIALLLVGVSAILYLLRAGQFGYFNDDWYEMYAAKAYGATAFREIFSIDRPGRALLMAPLYWLFGPNPLWYSLNAYLFRVLGALAFWWTMRMLWPRQHAATAWMALLFLVYPGFLSQPNAIDYQSHIFGLTLAWFSIGLSIRALAIGGGKKLVLVALAILTGWAYLSQMEYYIGFELIRFLLIMMVVMRQEDNWNPRILSTLRQWLVFIIIPLTFVIWRIFFFQGERKATDIGMQLGGILYSPLQTAFAWLSGLILDSINVLLAAWVVPLYQLSSVVSPLTILLGVLLGVLVFLASVFVLRGFPNESEENPSAWRLEALWVGLASLVAGLLPVVLANRQVSFPDYSRYTLISMGGVTIVLVAGLYYWSNARLRLAVVSVLLLLASLTHYANGVSAAQQTTAMRSFWWQVSWRIPQLERNTTLVAYYPFGAIQEDYFVWGPANLIYYPEKLEDKYIQPGVYAAVLNDQNLVKILTQQRQEYDLRRTIRTYANYRNILILTQSKPGACVRVIDGLSPELSAAEQPAILTAAPYSEIDHVLTDQPVHIPPKAAFGLEPPHGWCYYYEKASLARQQENWQAVAQLGDEAISKGLSPSDQIEWLPFLQAYAVLGRTDLLSELAPQVSEDLFASQQTCQILGATSRISDAVSEQVISLFCVSN